MQGFVRTPSPNAKVRLTGKRNRCRSAIDLLYVISSCTLEVSSTHTKKNTKVVKSFSTFSKRKSAKRRRVQLTIK